MEIDLTPEQEARLTELARERGTSVGAMVADYALDIVHMEAREREIIQERIEEADRGDFIEEEEMDRRVARMLEAG